MSNPSQPPQQQVTATAAAANTSQQLSDNVAHGGGALEDHNSEQQQQDGGAAAAAAAAVDPNRKTQRRYCRFPGCTRVIKSQGHCQRHGAKTKRCRVEGCDKQAQGTHDGMCKRHWKAIHFPEEIAGHKYKGGPAPPPPSGDSVYDSVLPQSIAFRPPASAGGADPTSSQAASGGKKQPAAAMMNESISEDMDFPPEATVMPLVAFLRKGRSKVLGWHRNEERRARGLFPVSSLSSQLEPWERQLVSPCVVYSLLVAYLLSLCSLRRYNLVTCMLCRYSCLPSHTHSFIIGPGGDSALEWRDILRQF